MSKGGRREGAGRKPGSYLIPDHLIRLRYRQYRASKPAHPRIETLAFLLAMNPRHLRRRLKRLRLDWPIGHALAAAAALGVTWFIDDDFHMDGLIHVVDILLLLTDAH